MKKLKVVAEFFGRNKELFIPCTAGGLMLVVAAALSQAPREGPGRTHPFAIAATQRTSSQERLAAEKPGAKPGAGLGLDELLAMFGPIKDALAPLPVPAAPAHAPRPAAAPAVPGDGLEGLEDEEGAIDDDAEEGKRPDFRQLAPRFYQGEGSKGAFLAVAEGSRGRLVVGRQADRAAGAGRPARAFFAARGTKGRLGAGPGFGRSVQSISQGIDTRGAALPEIGVRAPATAAASGGSTAPLAPVPAVGPEGAASGAGSGEASADSGSGSLPPPDTAQEVKLFSKAAKAFAVQGPVVKRRYLLCTVRAYHRRYGDSQMQADRIIRSIDTEATPYFLNKHRHDGVLALLKDLRAEVLDLRSTLRKSEADLNEARKCFRKTPKGKKAKDCYERAQGPISRSGRQDDRTKGPLGPDATVAALLASIESEGARADAELGADPSAEKARAFLRGRLGSYKKALETVRESVTQLRWGQAEVVKDQWPEFYGRFRAVMKQLNQISSSGLPGDQRAEFEAARRAAYESLTDAKTAWILMQAGGLASNQRIALYSEVHRLMQEATDRLSEVCVTLGLEALPRPDKPDIDGDGGNLLIEVEKCDPKGAKR